MRMHAINEVELHYITPSQDGSTVCRERNWRNAVSNYVTLLHNQCRTLSVSSLFNSTPGVDGFPICNRFRQTACPFTISNQPYDLPKSRRLHWSSMRTIRSPLSLLKRRPYPSQPWVIIYRPYAANRVSRRTRHLPPLCYQFLTRPLRLRPLLTSASFQSRRTRLQLVKITHLMRVNLTV